MQKTDGIFDKLVGLDEVKAEIDKIVKTMSAIKNRQKTTGVSTRIGINTLIIGNTGTGKTSIANMLQQLFFSNQIITKPVAKIVDAVNYKEFAEEWDDNINQAKGGILFIDNVQKLLPDGYSKEINELDKLFHSMDSWNDDPIVVLAGLPSGFNEFLNSNPNIKNRFDYSFILPDYTQDQLVQICTRKLQVDYQLQLNTDTETKLNRYIKQILKTKNESFGNAHFAVDLAENIFKAYLNRIAEGANDDSIVLPQDITANVAEEKTFEQIMAEMDDFIGMHEIKKAVSDIAKQINTLNERTKRGMSGEKPAMHFVLTGNPGTGKTTIARKLGEIFAAMEFLDSGHVVEVDRSQMVSQYKGETPKLVNNLCDKAMGGILFVDEAYTLAPANESGQVDQYGKEAVETLMKRMEDDRDKFVVIVAGYKIPMDGFLRVNAGLQSRFNSYLHIDDYTPDELRQIFKLFVKKKKYVLSSEAETKLDKALSAIYEGRDKDFGNGREMRKLFENTSALFSERISKLDASQLTDEDYFTILPDDIPYTEPKELSIDECLQDLNKLSGLDNVKEEVNSLVKYLNLERERVLAGGAKTPLGMHFVYTGNPGTGKTTVARIMAKVFKSLGILPKGHLVETDRSDMVAAFLGQTAIKVNQLVDKAMGGVLFIDEAYTLASSENDSFGKEAIDSLLKRLEDDRGKFICIIAGYTKQMEDLLDTNPGLRSRFNRTIEFQDYKPKALTDIFFRLVENKGLNIDADTKAWLPSFFEGMYLRKDDNFGNAREVRKVFENALTRQSNRLAKIHGTPEFNNNLLNELLREDIETENSKPKSLEEVLSSMDDFIGMNEVKNAVRKIANQVLINKQRIERGIGGAENIGMNIILTGNPGTGKTTVARKLGEIFKAIGFLPSDKVIEVDRSQMVGQFLGETPKIVDKLCKRAMGGILFVDEAYTLSPTNDSGSKDQFGTEAIETLMKRMEDDRGKFVVIAAGYQMEMDGFIRVNPGLDSRFNERIHIADYKPNELLDIFKLFAKKKSYIIPAETEVLLVKAINEIYDSRTKNFGNAREMRRLFEETSSAMSSRISKMDAVEISDNDYITILPDDIPIEESKQLNVSECLGDLNKLIGLDNVKQEVESLVNFLNIEKERAAITGIKTPLSMHFVFTGNPGTGKTTVARIMANVFKSLGILSKGHLVEVDRSQMVAGYIGQTSIKVNQLVDKAMGGVLFIDEAYTLSSGSGNDFGQEAIDTLLKRLEDDRGKFICIAAGYTNEMEGFLETNPGLRSRFNKKIDFIDYNPDALLNIFKSLANSKKFEFDTEVEQLLPAFFESLYNNRDKNFGNAREVRKIFENALTKQSQRITTIFGTDAYKPEMLQVLTKSDIL